MAAVYTEQACGGSDAASPRGGRGTKIGLADAPTQLSQEQCEEDSGIWSPSGATNGGFRKLLSCDSVAQKQVSEGRCGGHLGLQLGAVSE